EKNRIRYNQKTPFTFTQDPINNSMIRIAIAGAAGRMGKRLIQATAQHNQVTLTAALVRQNDAAVGMDASVLLVEINPLNITI
ncbi:MAG: hypothetical protein K7J15_04040, partial [Candidatus Regiella insecticola]|nr:hypothetical protein [Candidatus Regiella insecticola]